MKKLIVGLTAAVMLAAGLTLGTTSQATAAPARLAVPAAVPAAQAPSVVTVPRARCPYTGCFRTRTDLYGPNPRKVHPNERDRARFRVTVRGLGTNFVPRGFFFIRLKGRAKANNRYVRFNSMVRVSAGGTATFRLRKLPLGKYRIAVRYYQTPDQPFSTSISGVKYFRVVKKARR